MNCHARRIDAGHFVVLLMVANQTATRRNQAATANVRRMVLLGVTHVAIKGKAGPRRIGNRPGELTEESPVSGFQKETRFTIRGRPSESRFALVLLICIQAIQTVDAGIQKLEHERRIVYPAASIVDG